ncbi:MAG: class I SAM-dependent methyltransferase [Patescibacteria group bacterium]
MTMNTKAVIEYFESFLKRVGERKGALLNIHSGEGESAVMYMEPTYEVSEFDADTVHEKWPYADKGFDLVLDIFCYEHQRTDEQKATYRRELKRVMKDDGLYLLSLANNEWRLETKEEVERGFFPSFVLVDYTLDAENGPSYIFRKNASVL